MTDAIAVITWFGQCVKLASKPSIRPGGLWTSQWLPRVLSFLYGCQATSGDSRKVQSPLTLSKKVKKSVSQRFYCFAAFGLKLSLTCPLSVKAVSTSTDLESISLRGRSHRVWIKDGGLAWESLGIGKEWGKGEVPVQTGRLNLTMITHTHTQPWNKHETWGRENKEKGSHIFCFFVLLCSHSESVFMYFIIFLYTQLSVLTLFFLYTTYSVSFMQWLNSQHQAHHCPFSIYDRLDHRSPPNSPLRTAVSFASSWLSI